MSDIEVILSICRAKDVENSELFATYHQFEHVEDEEQGEFEALN